MNKDEKAAAIEEISAELKGSKAVFAVDYRGISVPQAAELRTKLREADASFNVVKNRLAKRATGEVGATELDEHLVGPTAPTYVKGDPVVAAKTVSDFIKANEILVFKGGLMDGSALDPDQFKAISRLPGVDVLRGQLVGLAATPLTGVVRTLNQLIAGLATQLGQVAEKGLVGGDAAPAEEAKPADDAPADDVEAEGSGGDEPAPEAETPEAEAAESEASEDEAPEPEVAEAEAPEAEAAEDTKDSGDEDESGDSDESGDEETEQAPEASGDDADAESGDEKED